MSVLAVPASKKALFLAAQSLDRALDAGIPIVRAFRVAADASLSLGVRHAFRTIAASLDEGQTMEQALRPHRFALSEYFVEVLIAGQSSGQVHRLLPNLIESLETQIRIRRAIVLHLTYPAIILFAAFVLIPFASGFVLSTKSAEDYTLHFLRNLAHDWAILFAILFAVWIATRVRYVWLTVVYALSWLWPIRNVLLRFDMARFLYGLAAMLSVGYSNREAILRAIPLAENPLIARRLRKSLPMLDYGAWLADVLAKTRLVPPGQLAQLQAAEHTGLPEDGARRCARQLAEEAMHPVTILVANLQGIAIVIIGYLIVRGMI